MPVSESADRVSGLSARTSLGLDMLVGSFVVVVVDAVVLIDAWRPFVAVVVEIEVLVACCLVNVVAY